MQESSGKTGMSGFTLKCVASITQVLRTGSCRAICLRFFVLDFFIYK